MESLISTPTPALIPPLIITVILRLGKAGTCARRRLCLRPTVNLTAIARFRDPTPSPRHYGGKLQDDPRLVDYNVPERLEAFVSECDKLFNVTRGNDIMLTMGSDFTVRPRPSNAHVSTAAAQQDPCMLNKSLALMLLHRNP